MEQRTIFFRLFLGACLLLCLTALPTLAQTIRYVKPVATGTGTGASWANASGDLQAMINASAANDQIWVMAGTYKPTTGTNRTISFTVNRNVSIYGGFVGTETALNQRPAISVTVPPSTTLSGDIGTPNSTTDNTVTLIDATSGSSSVPIIDGFVLTACNSNSTVSGNSLNGAIRNGSSSTIRNCWFINNTNAQNGGAITNNYTSYANSATIQNCRFESNTALQGGAIYTSSGFVGSHSLKVINSVFVSNTAPQGGGAIAITGAADNTSNFVFTNCSFQSNASSFATNGFNQITGGGGVLYISANTNPTFTNCSFQGNRTTGGFGSIMFRYGGTWYQNFVNCVFFGNPGNNFYYGTLGSNLSSLPCDWISCLGDVFANSNNPDLKYTATNPFSSTTSTQLDNCSPAVDAGLNSAFWLSGITTDLAGNPRITNNRVDIGAYETGAIQGGAIAGPVLVPYPQESPNTLTSLTAASAPSAFTLSWQQSGDNGVSWADISNTNSQSILMPNTLTTNGNPSKTYQLRRIITNACGLSAVAGPVSVNVVRADGRFTGQVVSTDGITPVANVTITAVRNTTGLAGSPGSWTYTAVTGADGTYTIAPVYYGVQAGTTPVSVTAV
jgi:predicted outer membrane repeat protein